MVKSCNAHFHLNESFSEITIDDRTVESIFTIDDSGNQKKLVHCQTDKQGRRSRIERIVREDVMKVSMFINDVTSTAYFRKVK